MSSQGVNVGIGLKRQHTVELLGGIPDLSFLEVHAENYMIDGGPLHQELSSLRERYELTIHGVGLSLGSETPPDIDHLRRIKSLISRYAPKIFSEHLAWSSNSGFFFNDLLPITYTPASLQRIVNNVDMAQSFLGQQILLENPATYIRFDESSMPETAFITELIMRSGCGLLLDLNNVHVTCTNHQLDVRQYLGELPLSAAQEIHLAGCSIDKHTQTETVLLDDHGSDINLDVWALFQSTTQKIGSRPTLIERDNNIPPLADMMAEVRKAAQIIASHSTPMERLQ
jgi:uncharacterized protein